MKIYAYKGKDNLCGERIRLARAKNRITQSDLAARMQVAGVAIERDSISRIERGTRIVTDYELKIFSKAGHCNNSYGVFLYKKIHPMSKKVIDKCTQWVYNIIVAREQQERS